MERIDAGGQLAAINELEPRRQRARMSPLAAILLVALILRLVLATRTIVYHADEVWQYLEPAYGLVTGRWVRAWEFHDGIRGWFVPLLLAVPLALGHWIAPLTSLHLWFARGLLGVLSLGVPLAWYDLARPRDASRDLGPALVAAWVGAIWCEVVYFSTRTSAEGLALTVLFPAMALARRVRDAPGHRRQTMALGALLALGIIVRFQYLPAIGVIALWAMAADWRRVTPPLLAGGLVMLALGGLADLVGGQMPLLWIWHSIRFNLVQGRSEMFGTQPPDWLILTQIGIWGWASLLIVPFALVGARRWPVILAAAILVIAAHSAIAHKEYRFILLGSSTLVMLAAIGSAQSVAALARGRGWRSGPLLVGLGLIWTLASGMVATRPFYVDLWGQGETLFATQRLAGEVQGICGIAAYQNHGHPMLAASFINRPVPLLLFDGAEAPQEAAAMHDRFNAAIADRIHGASLPPDFHLTGCHAEEDLAPADQDMCLFVRPGACRGSTGDFAYQPAMERRGK